MVERYKKNRGNLIRKKGEEYVEEVLRNNVRHASVVPPPGGGKEH